MHFDYQLILMIDHEQCCRFRVQFFDHRPSETFCVHESQILSALYSQSHKKLLSYHFDGHVVLQEIDLAVPLAKQGFEGLGRKAIFVGRGFERSRMHFNDSSLVLTKFFKQLSHSKFEMCFVFEFGNFEDYDQLIKPAKLVVCGKLSRGSLICYEIRNNSFIFYKFDKKLQIALT